VNPMDDASLRNYARLNGLDARSLACETGYEVAYCADLLAR
jgi:hypothetical protein